MTPADSTAFLRDGFVVLRQAIPRSLAEECASAAWHALGVQPQVTRTWPGPVAHVVPTGDALHRAANAPAVVSAIDALVGAGSWTPRVGNIGNCVARFPTGEDSHDTGWHIDCSFHPDDQAWPSTDGQPWRVNVHSRGRGALLLYLLTDVTSVDAPTRIRLGSHLDVARFLAPAGERGIAGPDLVPVDAVSATRPVVEATGSAGDVFVLHPFLVHAAQLHRGGEPRLIAQPGVLLREPYALTPRAEPAAPVEQAIQLALRG